MGVGLPVSAAAGHGFSRFVTSLRLTWAILRPCIWPAGCLALQLGTSTYIRQPLPTSPDRESGLVVIAGSYNPPHHGHLMLGGMAEASQKGHSYLVPPASPSWQSGNGALPLLQVWTSPCSDWSESSKNICGQPLWATRASPGNAEGAWPLKCGSGHRVLQLQL